MRYKEWLKTQRQYWRGKRKRYNKKYIASRQMLNNFSQSLLKELTFAEKRFIPILESFNIKYLKQPYCKKANIIPDFVIPPPYFLVIEIDGEYHNNSFKQKTDWLRDRKIGFLGYRTIRFSNQAVLENPEQVKNKLANILEQQRILNQNCKDYKFIFIGGESRAIKPAKPIDSLSNCETVKNNK